MPISLMLDGKLETQGTGVTQASKPHARSFEVSKYLELQMILDLDEERNFCQV